MALPGRLAWAASLLAASACGGGERPSETPPPRASGWHALATAADRERLRNWRTSWVDALGRVRAAGQGERLAPEGALFVPDAALDGPTPPPGDYRCRVIKLGARVEGGREMATYAWFTCRIAQQGPMLGLTKIDGSQRPVGLLFPENEKRMIFLGTMMLGDEVRPMEYGRDPERDMIGAFERIGPRRWRLVLPAPRWESLIDVIEFVPAGVPVS